MPPVRQQQPVGGFGGEYVEQFAANNGMGGLTLGTGQMNPGSTIRMPKRGTFTTAPSPMTVSFDQEAKRVEGLQYSTNPSDIREYLDLAETSKRAGFPSLTAAMQAAASDPDKGGRSWQQYLKDRAQVLKDMGIDTGGKRGGSGGPFSSTNTSITQLSDSQASAMGDPVFRSELGRTMANDEVGDFRKALNQQYQKNPTVTSSSGYSDGKGSSTSTTTTRGGFDPSRFARQYAMSQEGWAERYTGVRFMEILDQALSNPNSLDDMIRGKAKSNE
jgi:hypothetical protein